MRWGKGRKLPLCLARRAMVVAIMICAGCSARAADLMEIYQMAQDNDPTFAAARHGFDVTREKRSQAVAGNLPTVTLSGGKNFTDATASFNSAAPVNQGIYAWNWTLQLTQPIMRPQNLLAYDEAEAQLEAARADFEQARQDLILRVAQAYFDVLVAQEDVDSAEAQLKAMEEQGKVAERGYKLGTASITDSFEAKSKAELARSQLVAARNDMETKRSDLEKLIATPIDSLAGLRHEIVVPSPQPANVSDWVNQAKDNNPAVRSQLLSLRAAGYTVAKARAENTWTLDFVASYGNNYSSGSVSIPTPYESRIRTSVAGLQFNLPIFAGGLNSSHIREAIANREKLSDQLEEMRRKAGAEAKQAYAGITNGLAQIEALRAAVEAGENSVKGNQAGYRLGIRINSDVLNAQQQLYASKRDLVKARYDTLLQGLKLKAAAGVLSDSDISVINGLLEH